MPLPDLARLKGQLYLLWDACLHRNLAQTLYQLDNRVFMLPLYQGTQFESLGDIQPLLLQCPADSQLLDWLEQQLCYRDSVWLFESTSSSAELLRYFQQLPLQQHPLGHQVLFRYQDPRVLAGFMAAQLPLEALFPAGIFGRVWVYDTIAEHWHCRVPQSAQSSEATQRFQLTDDHLKVMQQVCWQQFGLRLQQHLRHFFADEFGSVSLAGTLAIAERAAAQGWESERDIFLYGNILGYLGADFEKNLIGNQASSASGALLDQHQASREPVSQSEYAGIINLMQTRGSGKSAALAQAADLAKQLNQQRANALQGVTHVGR
ncbi:DUF4123 domain-containing protein [Shewanella algae]|uniref:DUF4123 domain-containing protein n=1 Tax=Shewanella algae TaxID=38313 RepID=UPI002231EB5D|nr:DUF4123 domain-containing protein [Shewanella algae]UZD59338.1 DUF4123 domain-containing protein [Shewanella algae]